MGKKKNCVKDIYVWLDGGRQKACSVKCDNKDIEKLLTSLEEESNKMFTYGESYKISMEKARLRRHLNIASQRLKNL